ncbi:hypothetical protein [Blautia sp. An249]|uniref:hypothetical protein n=1 Tax=Blautia sp. An249 TaxID=1965603 RepID=UPI001951F5B4|nr:hypothetical protein [Blautia sp. An249]
MENKIIFKDGTEQEILSGVTEYSFSLYVSDMEEFVTVNQKVTEENLSEYTIVSGRHQAIRKDRKVIRVSITEQPETEETPEGLLVVYNLEDLTPAEKEVKAIRKRQSMYESAVLVAQMQAQSLTDVQALAVKNLYPDWKTVIGQTVEKGYKFTHEGTLYKTLQDNLFIQEQHVPGQSTESLYAVIDETHAGTKEDPIPYNGNMELFEGTYYTQGGKAYLCNRDTGQPVYQALADLIGLYVEEIE